VREKNDYKKRRKKSDEGLTERKREREKERGGGRGSGQERGV